MDHRSRRSIRRNAFALALSSLLIAAPATASPPDEPPLGTGRIAGVVTGPDGAPAAEICVDAWTGDGWGGGFGMTEADGSFLLDGLTAGSYIVGFADCSAERRFPSEYYADATRVEDASPVPVSDGETSTISAQLDAGASLAGTVRDDAGDPAPWVCVSAEPTTPEGTWGSALTAGDGSFTLGGLRGGEYLLSFASCDAPIPVPGRPEHDGASSPIPPHEPGGWPYGYLSEYWLDADTADGATPVVAVDGDTVAGIDAVVQRASGLEIEVLDGAGAPAGPVCASASSLDGTWLTGRYGEGWVTIGGLEPGSVAVFVEDCGAGMYRSEWYEDADSLESADPITVPSLGAASVTVRLDDRPLPDLAVQRLQVRPVPIQTDAGSLPGTGTQREVDVTIRNEGGADAERVGLVVVARTRSDGARRLIGTDTLRLAAGRATTRTLRANLTGMVGDVVITASTCTFTERDLSDNRRSVASYAIVGGTGLGLTPSEFGPRPQHLDRDDPIDCDSLLWWETDPRPR